MSKSLLLSVDQSTQSTKAFVFDTHGCLVSKVSKPHRQIYPQPSHVEHDPIEILTNFVDAVEQALEGACASASDVLCLSITNQRETIVAWDAGTGEPVHNAIVWQDGRGSVICRELSDAGASSVIQRSTGLLLDPYFSASKLAWLVRNSSKASSVLAAGKLMAGTIDSWLVWNLTGGKVFATDYSNASRTMLFDLRRLVWDDELIRLFGLDGIVLPEPRPSDAFFGMANISALGTDLPIRGVMGDSHAALFGHRGWKPGDAKATYGTGSSLMRNIGPIPLEPPHGIVLSLGWGFGGAPCYVFEGNIHATGYTLKWLKDNLGLFGTDEEAECLASELTDNGGVYLVPAFSGLGAPWWEQGVRATITGLSHGSDRRHIVRAGLESIAYQIVDLVEAMDAETSVPLGSLHVDGAPTKNAFLMQFQADMLGIPVIVPAREELSALGAAYMGGLSVGLWASTEEVEALPFDSKTYLPSMPENNRRTLAEGWRSAVLQTISRKVE